MKLRIEIREPNGNSRFQDFDQIEVTIGRVQGNDIVLPKGNISKRHTRIVLDRERFIVIDLKSTNGTYVNGRRIESPAEIRAGDKIFIGDFVLEPQPAEPSAPRPVSSPGELRVVVTRDGEPISQLTVTGGGEVTIGRSDDNDVRLDHAAVSPRHATLFRGDEGLVLIDEGSRTGTRIDGLPVSGAHRLRAGARVEIGPFTLVVES